MLEGEAIDPALEAADQLFEVIDVTTCSLADELTGWKGLRTRGVAHRARIHRCLGMHQR